MSRLPNTARAVVYEAPERFAVRELPVPELESGDLIVEVLLAGVDGSDVHMFRGEIGWLNERAPVVFGDEMVGRVAAIGEETKNVRGLEVGDLVAVEARWPCNRCRLCRDGQYYLCENNPENEWYGKVNCTKPPYLMGAFASHLYVPAEALVYRIPQGMALPTALFAYSVLANGLRWTQLPGVGLETNVVVVGPGPQGLACVLAAAEAGATVIAVGLERDKERLAVAASLGAAGTVALQPGEETDAAAQAVFSLMRDVDIVIEVAGSVSAKQLAVELVRPTGTIVNVAIAAPQVQPVNWLALLMKEVTVLNPISHPHTVARALGFAEKLLSRGIDVGQLVSHIYGLDDAETAIRTAAYESGELPIKVAIDPTRVDPEPLRSRFAHA